MRLLFESESQDELARAKELLEENGIPVFISSEETYRMRPSAVLYKKGLWICLEGQFSDALKLLKNPNHEVAQPVDVEEFHHSLEEAQKEPLRGLGLNGDRILNVVMSIVIVAIIVMAAMVALSHNNFFKPTP